MPHIDNEGVKIHYDDVGSGEPLVWVAGTGISGAVWNMWQVPHFSRTHRCVTLDLRGTGASDSPVSGYSVPIFADDVYRVCQHLGIENAHFAGVSLGSAVIQHLAITRPELVRSASLISTWSSTQREHHIRRWFEARLLTLRTNAPVEVFRSFAFWMSSPTIIDLEPELQKTVEQFFAANSAAQPPHAYVGHFEADLEHDTMDRLGEIRCPTLVVYGDEDLITLPRYNDEVARRIPGALRQIIRGAGHLAWVERGAEVNEAIDAFLAGL